MEQTQALSQIINHECSILIDNSNINCQFPQIENSRPNHLQSSYLRQGDNTNGCRSSNINHDLMVILL